MTSLTEEITTNETNHNSEQYECDGEQSTETREASDNQDNAEEGNADRLTDGFAPGDALVNISPSRVNSDNPQEREEKEVTVNHNHEVHQSKKSFNSKTKHSSMPSQRAAYYLNDHPYGSGPYYYYQHQQSVPSPVEMGASLMFLSTQTSSSSTSSGRENSAAVSPQNLPPRLRHASTTENDTIPSPSAVTTSPPTSAPSTTTTTATTPHTNGRRHRSILPRTNSSFLPHPPPLMATPPGVLYPYPPAVHPSGPIAYSIRTPDELELLAFQQQMMNLPPGAMLWPPPGHPHFPPYPLSGLVPPPPSTFFPNHVSIPEPQTNFFLNPEAAEWIPSATENDPPSNEQILIDDEINFPPLNSTTNQTQTSPTNNKASSEETTEQQQQQQTDHSPEVPATTTDQQASISIDNSNISNSTAEIPSPPASSSSRDDHNTKPLSSSPVKTTPLNYSTILSQTTETKKSNKTNPIQSRSQQTTNHVHNQLPPRDRTTKQQQPQQQKPQINPSSAPDSNSRRRQPSSNHNSTNWVNTRNLLASDVNSPSKPALTTPELADEWIEVKSKKTKKFDRTTTESTSEKCLAEEQITQTFSPTLSLTSTSENTTPTTFTSEDDFDEKETRELRIVTTTTITTDDYHRNLIDEIHGRLAKKERLLIIMRGCPGSGKSTLAKLLNDGHNGVVLSADDYFTDPMLNTYAFDPTKLDDAHRITRQRASDAFKRNLSPIIIDNTNTQAWEMKPYVAMGKEAGYDILLVEPQTPWRHKARELFKRNCHNLPIRRIRDMLSRFEHDLTVQSLLDQISSSASSTSLSLASIEPRQTRENGNLDSTHPTKKSYELVDDSTILHDVRLCINDMILFLTSNFYQTTRSSSTSQSPTALAVSLHDLSLISSTPSSIPSTPSTPHARFPRTLTRFPSTTQDHAFNPEHLLRLPSSAFTRPTEANHLTPPLSAQSSLIEKKRKKNKAKQPANDLLLNVNNNNNRLHPDQLSEEISVQGIQEQTYQVLLLEDDGLDFVVIDEVNENQAKRNCSSPSSRSQKKLHSRKPAKLSNIIQSESIKPFDSSSPPTKHSGIQCLSDNLDLLTQKYSTRLSIEMIEQFYELCQCDHSRTCAHIDGYLLASGQHSQQQLRALPTLRQLSLEKLNQWDEQIISTDPSFDAHSMADLLEDIDDEEVSQKTHANQINIPCSLVNSLEEVYGELPNKSMLMSSDQGFLLPCDEQLTVDLHQALQRFLTETDQRMKPVRRANSDQKCKSAMENQANPSPNLQTVVPSFRQIMEEEQEAVLSQRCQQKQQLDYATDHKLKELQRQFAPVDGDLLADVFCANEYDYNLTYVCLFTMLTDTIALSTPPKTSSPSNSTPPSNSQPVEAVLDSDESLRHDALRHAQKRKDFYTKAQQASRHGMSGVAAYDTHCASEQTQLMESANREACERLFRWRLREFDRTQKLDLHGLHADEALSLFKQIEEEWQERNRRTTPKTIEIITGYGRNSINGGGCGKIRSVISTYLQERNYKYSEVNKGVLLLQF